MTNVMQMKPIIVPRMPRNAIMPKFSKKRDLRSEYPAENIIGGSMIAKKS